MVQQSLVKQNKLAGLELDIDGKVRVNLIRVGHFKQCHVGCCFDVGQ
tara:strand:- start:281 stop:421 length:141 start_codon:yes stop_codon:yes gene_type:complete